MNYSKEQLIRLNEQLQSLFKSLPKEIKGAKNSAKPVELDQTAFGRVSRIDAIQQQQMQKAAIQRMELRLRQVEQAMDKFGTDSFGLCSQCEEPISFERLKARPESALCIGCAEK